MIAVALVFARAALAGVFAIAAVAKVADPQGTRAGFREFGVRERFADICALLLPATELLVAGALLPHASGRWGAAGALGLLVVFAVGITAAIVRGRKPDCHCFGRLHSSPAGWATLARNVGLAGLAGFVVWRGPGTSFVSPFASLSAAERIGVLAAVVAATLFALQGWFSLQLLRQNGRLLLRLEALEGASSPSESLVELAVGAPAPAFSLPDLEGETRTLDSLRAPGKPVLLVFSDPDCAPCNALLPELGRWQAEHADKLTIALVSRGSADDNRVKGEEHDLVNVLLQDDREVADAYGADGTPGAILVGPDGRVATAIAFGPTAVAELIQGVRPAPAPRLAVALPAAPASNGQKLTEAAALIGSAAAFAAAAGPAAAAAANDPELEAIRAAIAAAEPDVLAAARRAAKAMRAVPPLKPGKAARATASRALEHERTALQKLLSTIYAMDPTGSAAQGARNLVVESLALLADSLLKQEHALTSRHPKDAKRLLDAAYKEFAHAIQAGANAQALLSKP